MFVMQNLIEPASSCDYKVRLCAHLNQPSNGRERTRKTEKIVMEHTICVCISLFFIAYIHVLIAILIETDLLKQKLID